MSMQDEVFYTLRPPGREGPQGIPGNPQQSCFFAKGLGQSQYSAQYSGVHTDPKRITNQGWHIGLR